MKQDEIKDIKYWKSNAEEDYMMKVPISVLRYITELENLLPPKVVQSEVSEVNQFTRVGTFCNKCNNVMCICNTLTPPDAEKEAVMFAEWVNGLYSQAWSKYNVNMSVWRDKTDLDTIWKEYTTQELFNLYKQGGQ